MISAGQYPTQGNYNDPYGYNNPYNRPPWQGQQQGPQAPSVPGIAAPGGNGSSMPTVSANVDLNSEDGAEIMKNQMLWAGIGMVANSVNQTLNQTLNYALQSKQIGAQERVAKKYYTTQDNIASYQRDVSLKQLAVQETAVYAQKDMHGQQMLHEEKMLRLEGSIQSRLASIQEDGKTRRAEIMTMNDAFSRRGWDMGMPALQA